MTDPRREPLLRDSKSSLFNAAREVVKANEEAAFQSAQAKPPAQSHAGLLVLLLLALAAAALLLLRPVWLAGPAAIPPEPPGIAAASLRLELLRERQRIFVYSNQYGRLPANLTEAGVAVNGIQYQASGSVQFSLSGRVGDSLITLHSTDSLSTFLGESLRRFKDRGAE